MGTTDVGISIFLEVRVFLGETSFYKQEGQTWGIAIFRQGTQLCGITGIEVGVERLRLLLC
jgi:hypothetical protein